MALVGQITTYQEHGEARRTTRRLLRLAVAASASGDATEALIHNISERGLLLETAMQLDEGDVLVVVLPQAGPTPAAVIWVRDRFAGCQFETPISKAAISAGLLKAAPEGPPYRIAPSQPLALRSDLQPEHLTQREEGPWVRALMIASLLLAFAIATVFILALLSFPFSAG